MKKFIFNQLVGRADFADRDDDITVLKKKITHGKKLVLYAPRRYGKSSLAGRVLPEEIKKQKIFTLYVDFMGCTDMDSVARRLSEGLFTTLKTNFKKQQLLKSAVDYLKNLGLGFTADPLRGEMGFELISKNDNKHDIFRIFDAIAQLTVKEKIYLVYDEFQDLSEIPEVLALIRSHLQRIKDTSVFFLGSKRKLLSKIFSSHNSPFFNYADEYVLGPIALKDWRDFFFERLSSNKIKITDEALAALLTEAMQVPNTICEIGAFIQDNCSPGVIGLNELQQVIASMLDSKAEGFRFQLRQMTKNEIQFCSAISKVGLTQSIHSKTFLQSSKMGASSAQKVMAKLYKLGIVEEESEGVRMSNPLLAAFLKYRPI